MEFSKEKLAHAKHQHGRVGTGADSDAGEDREITPTASADRQLTPAATVAASLPLGAELSSSETTICCAVGAAAEDATAAETTETTVHQSRTLMTPSALLPSFT